MNLAIVHTGGTVEETGRLMHEMAHFYALDMAPYAHLSILEIFDLIKSLPFHPDPQGLETVQRPYYTMYQMGSGGDCDDKCVALAAYCILHSIPYRFVALRRKNKKTLHHVACELYLHNRWVFADPTYSFNTFGREPLYVQRVYI